MQPVGGLQLAGELGVQRQEEQRERDPRPIIRLGQQRVGTLGVRGRLGEPAAGQHAAAAEDRGHALAGLVAKPAAQLAALAQQAVGVWVIALTQGEPGGAVQGPDSHRVLAGDQAEQLAQPLPPFGVMTMKRPEPRHHSS